MKRRTIIPFDDDPRFLPTQHTFPLSPGRVGPDRVGPTLPPVSYWRGVVEPVAALVSRAAFFSTQAVSSAISFS